MSSPVFHGLAGAGLAYAMAGDARLPLSASLRKAFPLLAAAAVLACLPDVDYLPGIWRGCLNTTHQQATHGVAWVLLVSTGIWLVLRAWRPRRAGWRAWMFLLVLIGSHLAIDAFTDDHFAPYGVPLGAPFSEQRYSVPRPLLPAWKKTSFADFRNPRNLRTLGIEAGAGLAVAGVCIGAKRGWTRRRGALSCEQ